MAADWKGGWGGGGWCPHRYGPNGKGCQYGGIPVDGTEFDQQFTCDCVNSLYDGENCGIKRSGCPTGAALVNGTCIFFKPVFQTRGPVSEKQAKQNYIDPREFPIIAVGETIRISPRVLDESKTEYSDGGKVDLKYSLTRAPDGFFINPGTGNIVGLFAPKDIMLDRARQAKVHKITLVVTDKSGLSADVETMRFQVQYRDTEDVNNNNKKFGHKEYGPNNRECANGVSSDVTVPDISHCS